MNQINQLRLNDRIKDWLIEDMPFGDVSSDHLFDQESGEVSLIAKENGVICGLFLASMIFGLLDEKIKCDFSVDEGQKVEENQVIGHISGPIKGILKGERLFLNLIQRLSGIATMSHAYALEVRGTSTRIVDTRKTTPGLRDLEKYAVVLGGCHNHRYSLSDAVMLKDNHIKGAGSIAKAVDKVRTAISHTMKVEVETEDLSMVEEALAAGADIIMLDNMSTAEMKEAVQIIRRKTDSIIIEASGNMTIERLKEVAEAGVDVISVGALTHSVSSMDISMKY